MNKDTNKKVSEEVEGRPEGDPAFPVLNAHYEGWGDQGMELRDYFAAKAMQGIVAAGIYGLKDYDQIPHWAYAIADAMIDKRWRK